MTPFAITMNLLVMLLAVLSTISLFSKRDGYRWFSKIENQCPIKGIFNFGDTYSDTGLTFTVFAPLKQPSPYGMTYFNKPVGRASDGRLYIDFIAGALGFPYLTPCLSSTDPDFSGGANFAVSGATVVMPPSGTLASDGEMPTRMCLSFQFFQFTLFKDRVVENQHRPGSNRIPKADAFGKALYTFNIGQRDFSLKLSSVGVEGAKQSFPETVSTIGDTLKDVYALGGRTLLVMNLAPVGCYPKYLVEFPLGSSDLDAYGCLIPINNAVQEYNKMLKETVSKTRKELVGATVVYFDTYSVLQEMIQHPESHGMKYGTRACCGYGGGAYNYHPEVKCGESHPINGHPASATACDDPHIYVSWDGLHYTEAANRILADAILNGSSSDPPFPFHQFCNIQHVV